ncbi:MAG: 6-carboxytetrahydropterin synthase QueD [Candidatus Cloacimonadota bacterium]|nr:MAG: 6-carboxytetrahydropterin synthase QueD [Candidatus Cloacimonadota bacterium]
MYKINVWGHFSGAHKLNDYQGNCANLHGHNWKVRLTVSCKKLNNIGMAIDFKDANSILNNILKKFDHTYLNENLLFNKINPTSENICKVIFDELSKAINNDNNKVYEIEVWESDKYSVCYNENS